MIELDHRGDVTVLRFDYGKVHALDLGLLTNVAETVRSLDTALVLTGTGRAFSAGVDLKRIVDGGADYVSLFIPALSEACLAVFDHPRPVVAAINGHAIAGGCVLACACDVRYMSGGTIGLTELLVGVPFPPVPLEISRHVLGTATTSMVVNGRTLTPGEALTIGLVDEVVDAEDLLDVAVHRAHELAKVPADVYALTKEQLHRPVHESLERSHPLDDARVLEHWQSKSTRAGMTDYLAGLAKRP